MYCWVIVEPLCRSWPRAMAHRERTMPFGEMPWLVQKLRSSAAMTAFLMFSDMAEYSTSVRFCTESSPTRVEPSR